MIAVIIIACLLIVTSVIHIVMDFIGEKKYPAPGKIAEFDDTKIHVFSKGKKEDSTEPCIVILHDTADFAPALKHYKLIKKLSEIKRTVIIERSGSGWSGDTFSQRTAENIVFEYRKALSVTDEGSKKYILVAFGNAALYAENWKKCFPDEIIRMVFVNDKVKKYNNIWEARFKPFLIAASRELGLLRIYGFLFGKGICSDESDNNKSLYIELFSERYMSAAVRSEIEYLSHNDLTVETVDGFDVSVENIEEIVKAVELQTDDNCEAENM